MPYLGASPRNINTRSVIDHQEYLGSQADTSTNSGYYTFYVNYTPGNVSVVIRGVHMASSDYTATNGTDVRISTSTITLANDDVIEIIGYGIPSSQILERSDVNITGGQAINLTQVGASSYKVGNTEVIDSSRIVDAASVKVAGTEVIDSSGNLISGTLGANVSFTNIADDAISGDKIHSGTISSSTLDGIKLKSSGDSITKSDGTTAVLSESGGTATLQNTRVWRTDILHVSGWYDGSSYRAPLYIGEMDRIAPCAYLNNTGEKAFFHWYIPDDCNEINTIDIIWYQSGNPGANQGELNFTTRVVINQGFTGGTNTTATVNLGASTNGQLRKTSVAGSTLLPTQTSGNYVIFEAEFGFSTGSAGTYGWLVGSLVINWR